jgi:hypothetical protein
MRAVHRATMTNRELGCGQASWVELGKREMPRHEVYEPYHVVQHVAVQPPNWRVELVFPTMPMYSGRKAVSSAALATKPPVLTPPPPASDVRRKLAKGPSLQGWPPVSRLQLARAPRPLARRLLPAALPP